MNVIGCFILWLGLDAIIVATIWWIANALKPSVSDSWWKRNVCNDDPSGSHDQKAEG